MIHNLFFWPILLWQYQAKYGLHLETWQLVTSSLDTPASKEWTAFSWSPSAVRHSPFKTEAHQTLGTVSLPKAATGSKGTFTWYYCFECNLYLNIIFSVSKNHWLLEHNPDCVSFLSSKHSWMMIVCGSLKNERKTWLLKKFCQICQRRMRMAPQGLLVTIRKHLF